MDGEADAVARRLKEHLLASGAYERLLAEARSNLRDSGWRDGLLKRLLSHPAGPGTPKRFDDLLQQSQSSFDSIPDEVRQALVAGVLDILSND